MIEIVNKFLLAGDIFIPKVHLRQSGFIYSACGSFKKRTWKQSRHLKKQEIHSIFIKTN